MSNFHAYIHARPDGTPFYVGKGKGRRCYELRGRSSHHQNVINKHGAENILVGKLDCSSEEIAFDLERGLIRCLRRMNVELTNKTDGGEGTSGYRHTLDAKRKCAAAATGANNAFYGKKRPEHSAALTGRKRPEHSAALSGKKRAAGWVNPNIGVPATEARKEKMRISCAARGFAELATKLFKGIPKSDLQKEKMSKSAKGHVWLNKNGKRTHCPEEAAKLLELEGWKRGQK